ncbi:MAG: hypothetical protein ACPF92_05070 [Candidatus Poseidoniaceae archaeon]
MTEPPRGFLELGTTEVGDEVAKSTRTSALVMAACGALGLLLALNARVLLAPALLLLVLATVQWRRSQGLRDLPFAVNANHPWVLDQAMGSAEVAIRAADGTWKELGDHRLKLHTDPLLGEPLVVEDHEPWDTVVRWPASSAARLQRWLVIGNTALALRDAVNGHDEQAEEARRRAAGETELLEREWPEEEDALDEGSALSRWLETARTPK